MLSSYDMRISLPYDGDDIPVQTFGGLCSAYGKGSGVGCCAFWHTAYV